MVALVVVYAIETISKQVHPCPATVDCTDPESLKRALEAGQIPLIKYGLILAGWLLAGYAGGLAAIRWSAWPPAVWCVAVLFTVTVLRTLSSFPHPEWMWIGGLIGCPLFVLGGGRQAIAVRGAR